MINQQVIALCGGSWPPMATCSIIQSSYASPVRADLS
jgi:hypothetical protein